MPKRPAFRKPAKSAAPKNNVAKAGPPAKAAAVPLVPVVAAVPPAPAANAAVVVPNAPVKAPKPGKPLKVRFDGKDKEVPREKVLVPGTDCPYPNAIQFTDGKRYSDSVIKSLWKAGYNPSFRSDEVNTHSKSAAHRAALEAKAAKYVKHDKVIWDVGGHSKRHRMNKRLFHCTQPMTTPSDAVHEECSCLVAECNCVEDPGLILMVHSAYYMTAADISRLALKAADCEVSFLSVEHPFGVKSMAGTFDDCKYEFFTSGAKLCVRFHSDETYTHELPNWFMQETVVFRGADHVVVRKFIASMGDTRLVQYHVATVEECPPNPITPHYVYDQVNVVPFLYSYKYARPSEDEITSVEGGYIALHRDSSPAWDFWYKHFIFWYKPLGLLRDRIFTRFPALRPSTPQVLAVPVPGMLIDRLQANMSLTDDIQTVDNNAKKFVQMNPQLLPEGCKTLARTYAAHAAYFNNRRLVEEFYRFHTLRTSTSFAFVVALCGFVMLFARRSRSIGTMLIACGFVGWLGNLIARRTALCPPPEGEKLIANAECLDDLQSLSAARRPDTEVISLPMNTPVKQFYQRVLPITRLSVQVFSTSNRNLHASVLGRLMRNRPDPVSVRWDRIDAFIQGLDVAEIVGKHALPTVHDWVATRKLSSQRRRFTLAEERLKKANYDLGSFKDWGLRSIFVKREKTFVAGKLPRVIVGATDELQTYFGPFFSAFDTRFQEWAATQRLFYCVGFTQQRLSVEVNAAITLARSCQPNANPSDFTSFFALGDDQLIISPDGDGGVVFVENDMGAFDTTHHARSLAVRIATYKLFGMTDDMAALWATANTQITMVTMKGGGRYKLTYNMCSGNPDTCSGNSLINLFTARDMYQELVPNYEACQRLPQRQDDVAQALGEYGFIPKAITSKVFSDVSFLSGIFLLNSDGSWQWIPKVFRLIVKLCFSVDPSINRDLLLKSYRFSFGQYSAVPVLRAMMLALPLVPNDQRGLEQVRHIASLNRSLWFKPGCEDPSSIGNIDESFRIHYGLTALQLTSLEQAVARAITDGEYLPPNHEALFRQCFDRDVAEYSD